MAYQEAYYLANLQLGVVLARIGRPDLAIKHFEDALRVRPGDSDAKRNLDRARALVNQARRR
jgi:tetratricopeptide (TPR) repeat protein